MCEGKKRRWFRFSLRTMFLVVTVGGFFMGWLARQMHVVKKRHQVLAAIRLRLEPHGRLTDVVVSWKGEKLHTRPKTASEISIIRRWLGDQPREMILAATREDAHLAQEWFPEPGICYITEPLQKVVRLEKRNGATVIASDASEEIHSEQNDDRP